MSEREPFYRYPPWPPERPNGRREPNPSLVWSGSSMIAAGFVAGLAAFAEVASDPGPGHPYRPAPPWAAPLGFGGLALITIGVALLVIWSTLKGR